MLQTDNLDRLPKDGWYYVLTSGELKAQANDPLEAVQFFMDSLIQFGASVDMSDDEAFEFIEAPGSHVPGFDRMSIVAKYKGSMAGVLYGIELSAWRAFKEVMAEVLSEDSETVH